MKITRSKQGLKTIALIKKISKVLEDVNIGDDEYKQGHKQGFIDGWNARMEAEKKEKEIDEFIREGI